MPLDSDSLGSLRIDRSVSTSDGGGSKRLIYIGVAVVIAAALAFGLWSWLGKKTLEVTTVTAEADSSGPSLGNSVLNASGYVVARRMATVSSKVTGKVLEIFVEEGMEVQKDQVLARLDPVNSRTILTMAERELDAARRNLTEIEVRLAEAQAQPRAQRSAGQAAAREPDGARYLARGSERAGRRGSRLRRRRSRCRRASSPCAASTTTI